MGRWKKFYTVVMDVNSGRIVWPALGGGASALRKFWRLLRLNQARIEAVANHIYFERSG